MTARLVSVPVQQALDHNIVVDNRPGSGGLIATQEGARATPDGHTLLLSTGAQMAKADTEHFHAESPLGPASVEKYLVAAERTYAAYLGDLALPPSKEVFPATTKPVPAM